MDTETLVDLLWRMKSQPSTTPRIVRGRVQYDSFLQYEETFPLVSSYLYATTVFPPVTKLGSSTFGEVIK